MKNIKYTIITGYLITALTEKKEHNRALYLNKVASNEDATICLALFERAASKLRQAERIRSKLLGKNHE